MFCARLRVSSRGWGQEPLTTIITPAPNFFSGENDRLYVPRHKAVDGRVVSSIVRGIYQGTQSASLKDLFRGAG
jgi:hypothetical protein